MGLETIRITDDYTATDQELFDSKNITITIKEL